MLLNGYICVEFFIYLTNFYVSRPIAKQDPTWVCIPSNIHQHTRFDV